jgi:hypothetical protein
MRRPGQGVEEGSPWFSARRLQRQEDAKSRADVWLALHFDVPIMILDNFLTDVQAQADARARFTAREKGFENAGKILSRDPLAVIPDLDDQVRRSAACLDLDATTLLSDRRDRVLGVVQQVQQDLVLKWTPLFGPKTGIPSLHPV